VISSLAVAAGRNTSVIDKLRPARSRFSILLCRPLAVIALSSSERELILADVACWEKYGVHSRIGSAVDERGKRDTVANVLAQDPCFRNLLYYRLSHGTSEGTRLLLPLMRRVWRPLNTLHFWPGSLGPGCFIMHGWETQVFARSIGSNFVVAPRVSIGAGGPEKNPTVGDNVSIRVGAIVIGDITIGDGAEVGAGAVVARDVPEGVTVVGLPARPVL